MHKNLKIIINKEITYNKKREITKKANKAFSRILQTPLKDFPESQGVHKRLVG